MKEIVMQAAMWEVYHGAMLLHIVLILLSPPHLLSQMPFTGRLGVKNGLTLKIPFRHLGDMHKVEMMMLAVMVASIPLTRCRVILSKAKRIVKKIWDM
ncbi:unnamed protein product [Linum trigynum]|uniref:Uncharacterized protein n=1 Tax=Linum trigynum TaxID=586398 RepID=A0AAV2CXJ9_9ROSI